jgi:hypothetical protein
MFTALLLLHSSQGPSAGASPWLGATTAGAGRNHPKAWEMLLRRMAPALRVLEAWRCAPLAHFSAP